MASQILSHALDLGIAVPDQLAIIGTDNIERFCTFGKVEMSSIDPDVPQIAYKAAELLAKLMAGGRPPLDPILIPPRGLIARRSTDQSGVQRPNRGGRHASYPRTCGREAHRRNRCCRT